MFLPGPRFRALASSLGETRASAKGAGISGGAISPFPSQKEWPEHRLGLEEPLAWRRSEVTSGVRLGTGVSGDGGCVLGVCGRRRDTANEKQVEGLHAPARGQAGWDGPVSRRTCHLTDNPTEQAPGCPFIFIMCEVGGCKVSFLFI